MKKVPCSSIFSEPSKELSIIIPAYNEEDRLPATLQETLSYLQRRRDRQGASFTYEVIIVDDGSSDGTVRAASEFVRRHGFDAVRVLRLPQNCGKGYAVKSGMLCSRGQRLLMMDADGATKVSDLERLETKLAQICTHNNGPVGSLAGATTAAASAPAVAARSGGLGFVLGSRAHMQEAATAKRSALRNFLMHGFHLLVMAVVGNEIRDTQCGFKLFSRGAAQQLYSNQRLQRWCFDVELVYLAQQLKCPMAEVQVNWTEIPGSKIRVASMAHMALELAMIRLGYTGGVWKVRTPQEVGKMH
ncbi:Dolichyl-phosphate beta-glucosyltransferase [Micractinium conductrix]|uniref:dolichyl-phosphate beta-glucosyltransferase n=1 Tax=Micractinium conductrix TaxID=554055 RepID=A0A2P6VK36_9CHLO|nr:Dolichyl-phosphate beta-glucosyltransferase [Micractinium conductrix]|eukprot:PSC74459.1 Dolichyl-phosphate beta-glucosyltransferase [Micractinium conductrix]